jgi:putative tryptophan/tyrosine transport system substrate-binding protein
VRRRDFIVSLTGAVAAWPLTGSAQQAGKIPVVGFLHSASRQEYAPRLAAFHKGLNDAGFIEGRNVAIEYRWADGRTDQLASMVADLIHDQVAVIATPGSAPAAVVAKTATTTIPIVFATGADPVDLGLVASLNRPGGNVTGVISQNVELAAKRLEVLRELVPQATRYFALVNPASPLTKPFVKDLQVGATTLGIQIDILRASNDVDIADALASLPQKSGAALIFASDGFFYSRRDNIVALVANHAVPAIYDGVDYVKAGGLASYGADFLHVMELAGEYTGRVLKGEKPADLPVVRAEKFELTINLKTAKDLGLAVPDKILALADEVIE